MTVLLTTHRMVLRALTEADTDHLCALDGDPAVMRFLGDGRPTTPETVRRQVLPRLVRRYDHPAERGFWAAEDRGTGDFLGWFEFRPLEGRDPGTVELGYRLLRTAWGRGLATEGSRALLHKGFAELGVRRVTATTMAVNTASRRVMEKAGLRHVRTFHEDWPHPIEGSEHGEVEYALTRDEWRRRRSGDGG